MHGTLALECHFFPRKVFIAKSKMFAPKKTNALVSGREAYHVSEANSNFGKKCPPPSPVSSIYNNDNNN